MNTDTPDVVVIGGGIIGACASYWLARSGLRTVTLEQGDAVSGASGANLGQISIIDRHEPWHLRLSLDSLEIYREIPGDAGIEYTESGGSVVLMTAEQLEAARRYQSLFREQGVPMEIAQDASRWEPRFEMGEALAFAHCPWEGKLNPLATALHFHRKAREAGARLFTQTPVQGFKKEGKRISAVITPAGEFHPRWVLNAAGSWSGAVAAMAGLSLPIRFHRGAAMVSEALPETVRGPLVEGSFLLPPVQGPYKPYIAFDVTQTAEGSLVIGQANDSCALGNRDITLWGLTDMAKRFLRHFPSLKTVNILRSWASVTTYTEDGLPVYGFSREVENFFTAAGFKGAFTTAPALGKRIPADLQGAALDDEWRRFRVDREAVAL